MEREFAPIEIVSEKLEQAVKELKASNIDLWVTFGQETSSARERIWDYIGVSDLTWESAIIIAKNGDKIVILGKFDEQPYRDSNLYTEIKPYVKDFKEPFGEVLLKYKPKSVALNFSLNDPSADGITYGKFLYLEKTIRDILGEVNIVSAEKIIQSLISQKSQLELDYIREAVKITENIFKEITLFLKVGKSEVEVYDFIQSKIKEKGLKPSFETLVFAGDRGDGMGHGKVSDNRICHHDLVHVDMGVFYKGYASDLQRTWFFLKNNEDKAPDIVLKGFYTIRDAIVEAGKELKPMRKGVEIDEIARKKVIDSGFEEYPHALGHQLGRFVHDGGALLGPLWERYKNTPLMEIKTNQVFTLEPSLKVTNHGAIGLEEDVIVTENGAKFISEPQKELIYIKG